MNNYIPTETLSPRVKQTITKLLSMVRFQQVVLFLVITAAFIPARLDVEILQVWQLQYDIRLIRRSDGQAARF